MKSRALLIAALFLLPNLLGFATFTFMPVVASFGLSFCTWDPVAQEVNEIAPAGLSNYGELLGFHHEQQDDGATQTPNAKTNGAHFQEGWSDF